MTVSERPAPVADRTLLVLGGVGVIAVLWSVAVIGMPGLPRYLAIGCAALAVAITVVRRRPWEFLAWIPVLIVPPEFLEVFAHEVVVVPAALFIFIYALRKKLPWVYRIHRIELVLWLFIAWALFSVFWVRESWLWLFGMRKLLMGAIAMWFAWRYSRFVDGRILLGGIAATSVLLSLATIRQAYSVGWFGAIQHTHMRRTATNLGWGDANYIAALLTMLLPTVINQALTAHSKALRWLGIAGVLLTAIVVTIASSRGGSLLTLAIALFMIFRSRIKSWVVWVSAPAAIALILLGPGAQMLLARFHNAEDLESVVIRLWFWRVAWHRLLTFWPWGMGLGQGFRYLDRLYEEDPHDVWLMLGSELGLVGLALWITVLVLVYRRILKIAHDPDTRVEGQALQLTFWITQFNALFEPTIFGIQYFFLLNWIWASYFGWADRVWERRDAARAASARPDGDPAPGPSIALSGP